MPKIATVEKRGTEKKVQRNECAGFDMVEKATEPWKVPEDSAHRKVT